MSRKTRPFHIDRETLRDTLEPRLGRHTNSVDGAETPMLAHRQSLYSDRNVMDKREQEILLLTGN